MCCLGYRKLDFLCGIPGVETPLTHCWGLVWNMLMYNRSPSSTRTCKAEACCRACGPSPQPLDRVAFLMPSRCTTRTVHPWLLQDADNCLCTINMKCIGAITCCHSPHIQHDLTYSKSELESDVESAGFRRLIHQGRESCTPVTN